MIRTKENQEKFKQKQEIKEKEDIERVLSWFEKAKADPYHRTHINMWYPGHNVGWKKLKDRGILKEAHYGKVYVGTEFEKGLFTIEAGSGDCEELLVYHGQII